MTIRDIFYAIIDFNLLYILYAALIIYFVWGLYSYLTKADEGSLTDKIFDFVIKGGAYFILVSIIVGFIFAVVSYFLKP